MTGIGIDLCEIARMDKLLSDDRFLDRFFAAEEKAYVRAKGRGQAQTMAGIFAAKEAVVKALGTGIGPVALSDVVISHTQSGQPFVRITPPLLAQMQKCGAGRVLISITHENNMAAAVAVMEA